MDSKFYVSYEAARLLKEKGYDGECINYYDESGKLLFPYHHQECHVLYPVITKAEAIDWLESKGIYISIYYKIDRYNYNVEYKNEHFRIEVCGIGETRLEAEDAAIIKALELIDYEKRKSNL